MLSDRNYLRQLDPVNLIPLAKTELEIVLAEQLEQIPDLEKAADDAVAKVTDLEGEVEELTEKYDRSQETLANVEAELDAARDEFERVQQRYADRVVALTTEIATLKARLADASDLV